MYKLFARYASVGMINTAIHWIFFIIIHWLGANQAMSNMLAFLIAVTFSFFANARFTFKKKLPVGDTLFISHLWEQWLPASVK